MRILSLIRSNTTLLKLAKRINIYKEYLKDAHEFCRFYSEGKTSEARLEYKMLYLTHSLEKGICIASRPFGQKKIEELCELLQEYMGRMYPASRSSFKMSVLALKEWVRLFDENKWTASQMIKARKLIADACIDTRDLEVGKIEMTHSQLACPTNISFEVFAKTRRSVRNFSTEKLKNDDVRRCVEIARTAPSACNRQMVKIYEIADPGKKLLLDNAIKGIDGFDKQSVNYFVVTYDISSLMFYGERHQGFFNAGLFAMTFANALHSLGIGSCFLQWSNYSSETAIIKRKLRIADCEKIACIIGAGYYAQTSVIPCSHRKNYDELFFEV